MLALACLVQLRCGAQFIDEGGAMFDDEEEPPDPAPKVHLAGSQIKSGGPLRVPPRPKVERSLPYDHPANFVYKQHHPLNTGIPGKLYNRYDRVTPIVDACARLQQMRQMGYMNAFRAEEERRATMKTPAPVEVKKKVETPVNIESHPNPDAFFKGLVNHLNQTPEEEANDQPDHMVCPGSQTKVGQENLSADKDCYVCDCGMVVQAVGGISLNRERNCQESEDNTIRADAVYEPKTDRFDHPAPSAEEARRQRARDGELEGRPPLAQRRRRRGGVVDAGDGGGAARRQVGRAEEGAEEPR